MNADDQQEVLERWYAAMREQDREETDNWKKRFDSRPDAFTEPEQKTLYHLLSIRYYLMRNDMDKAELLLEHVKPVKEKSGHRLNYYYYFFLGIYHYNRKEYRKAIEYYLKAKPIVTNISLEEMGEFYYKLASAFHRSYRITLSVKYAEKALDIFRRKSNHERIADCQNLLGINNTDIKQYEEAERHFHDGLLSVDKTNNKYLKMLLLHNSGLLYSNQNDPKAALDYLTKAKKLIEPWDNTAKLRNLFLLALNYFRNDQYEEAMLKLNFAICVSKEFDYPDYFHHCSMLEAEMLKPDRFEKVYKEGISFFCNLKRWDFVIEYSEELAAYYQKELLHKEANDYFQLAITAKNKIEEERALSHEKTLV